MGEKYSTKEMGVVVPGSSASHLVERLAKAKKITTQHRLFPDNEVYVRIEGDVRNKNVTIVQETSSNDKLVELFLLLDAVARQKPKKTSVLIPYYGYARQDKVFLKGEPVSAETVANILSHLGADRIVALDPHFNRKPGVYMLGKNKIHCVSTVEFLAQKVCEKTGLKNPVVLGPDLKAGEMSQRAANAIGASSQAFSKKRLSSTRVEVSGKVDVAGRNVLLIDDMISTGGTMIKAMEKIKDSADKIVVAGVHGVFSQKTVGKLKKAGAKRVFATDTLKHPAETISIAPIVEKMII